MTIAAYPGRFDPVTNGHLDIVLRAAEIFEKVVVGVAKSSSSLFTLEERVELFREAVKDLPHVSVAVIEGLTVDFARSQGARVLVRGIRAVTDFESEFQQALMNRKQAPAIETLMIVTDLNYLFVSATLLKEIAMLGGDLDGIVTPNVAQALHAKIAEKKA